MSTTRPTPVRLARPTVPPRPRRRVRRALATCLLMAGAVTMSGCQTLFGLSPAQEARLGAEAAPQFIQQYGGEVPDASLQAYVERVGNSMTPVTEDYFPDLEWEFILLDSAVVNAFALPGGKVFITRGLASQLEDESELAGVLGHEIGHVTARHGSKRVANQTGLGILVAGAAVLAGTTDEESQLGSIARGSVPFIELGGTAVVLKFGRDEELEADRLGMRYMSRVGYDPSGQLRVMQLLAELSGGSPGGFDLFATHPDPQARVRQIQDLLGSEYQQVSLNGDGRFRDRFQRDFLTPESRLPQPTHLGFARPGADGETVMLGAMSWCLHCAGEAAAYE